MRGGTGRLIARDGLVAAVLADADRHRLVSLTGRPGVGKTAVALAAAAASPWPAHVVPVEDARDRADYAARLHAVLGPAGASDSSEATAAARLRETGGLLLLDGCRSTAVAAGFVEHLLEAVPGLRVLVTGPAPLSLAQERRLEVPPLDLPAPDETDPEALASSPAVSMFLAAAEEAAPGREPTPADLATVAEVCRRLDGLPEALLLAAARLRLMAPAAMLSEMSRIGAWDLVGLSVADEVARTVEVLDPTAAVVLCALSTARSGAGVDAVAAIADLSGSGVVAALSLLVDLHLVRPDQVRARYVLTSSAAEHLSRRGLHDCVPYRLRHATFYAAQARAFARRRHGTPMDPVWLLDHHNRLTAVETLRAAGDRKGALRLAVDSMPGFEHRGEPEAGRRLLADHVGTLPESTSGAYVSAQTWLGRLAAEEADGHGTSAARGHLETALRLARTRGDLVMHLEVLNAFCENQVVLEGGVELCEASVAEGLALTQDPALEFGRSVFLNWHAANLHRRGRLTESVAAIGEALDIARRWDDRRLVMSYSIIYWQLPREVRAALTGVPDMSAILEMARAQGDVRAEGWAYMVLCGNALDDGALHEALDQTLSFVRHARRTQQRPLGRQAVFAALRLLRRHDEPVLAATLCGTLSTHDEGVRAHLPPRWVADAQACVAETRAALGDAAFDSAHSRGQTMTTWYAGQLVEAHLSTLRDRGRPDGLAVADDLVTPPPTVPAVSLVGPRPLPAPAAGGGGLTPREHAVLAALAEGLSNKEVARRLSLRPKTVAHHCAAIYGKLDVRGRTEAVAVALGSGLLTPHRTTEGSGPAPLVPLDVRSGAWAVGGSTGG